MPNLRPISDLRNHAAEISDFCRQTREPVYITRNGSGDMAVLNMEEYVRRMALIDLYGKLAVEEQEIAAGATGKDFLTVAKELRGRVHGNVLSFDFPCGGARPFRHLGLMRNRPGRFHWPLCIIVH